MKIPHSNKLILLLLTCHCSTNKALECGLGTVEENGECIVENSSTTVPSQDELIEYCDDGEDNDADGYIDCEDQDCEAASSCDADGDGFTVLAGDCNDQNPNIGPHGTDGLIADRNCDGSPAEGSLEMAEYTFLGESPDDYAGYWVASAGDVDGDGLDDILTGAYDDDDMGSNAGAAYLILGKSLQEHGTFGISNADYKIVGENAGDWAGFVVDGGDVDGDGLDDILIGAYGVADKGPITGAAYLLLGTSFGSEKIIYLSQADYKFTGEGADDYAGYALTIPGDVDGDNKSDILIGASGQDEGGLNSGAGYLILASSLGAESQIELSQADYKFIGEAPDSWAGYSISGAGDVDGDGLTDILLGADGDDGGTESHVSYLVLANSLGQNSTIYLSQADYKFIGEESYDYASQVSSAGDVDGDGLDDIIIGAAGHDNGGSGAGAAYIILASSLGMYSEISLAQADYRLIGENPYDYAGSTVANAGDIDGDGLDDILVGALDYHAHFPYQGAAYVVLGNQLQMYRDLQLSQAKYRLRGNERDYAGVAVSSAGDIDGDGFDDILIGGYGGPDWNGVMFVVTGG